METRREKIIREVKRAFFLRDLEKALSSAPLNLYAREMKKGNSHERALCAMRALAIAKGENAETLELELAKNILKNCARVKRYA